MISISFELTYKHTETTAIRKIHLIHLPVRLYINYSNIKIVFHNFMNEF